MTNALERIYFFLVVFGVYSVGAFGQSKSKEWIDSMETYINQNEPRDSIGLLEKMDLAFNLLKYDRPKAMRMLAEANRSANELQLPYVEAMIYLRRATVMRLTRNLDSAQYYLLKAKPIFNKRKRPVDIKGWYSEMAGFHMGKGQLDSALVYFQKSTQITRKMGDSSALVKALGNKALIYMHMKKLQLATAYIDSAIVLNEQIGAKSDLVGLYNIQSRIFEERGMRKHSLDIGLKILELSKELGLQNNLAMQYYNVGLAYNKLKDYNKSIIFYKKGWPYLKKFPRADLELAYLFQTGYAYNEINQVDSAKFYLQLTEDMAKEQKDYSRYCRALHTRGLIYYQEGNLTEYLQNMVTVAEYMPKLKGDVLYEAQREFGKVFYRTLTDGKEISTNFRTRLGFSKDYFLDSAQHYFVLALQGFEENKNVEAQHRLNELLSMVYLKKADYEMAHHYLSASVDLTDTLHSREKNAFKQAIESRYAFSKRVIRDSMANVEIQLKKDAQIAKEQALVKQRTTVSYAAVSSSVLLLLLAASIFQSRKKTQKQKIAIEKRNTQIEWLLKEIHHRVKNNMQIVSSLMSIQSRSLKDEQSKQVIRESQNRIKSMSLVHESLYQAEDLSQVEIGPFIQKIARSVQQSLQAKDQNIQLKLETDQVELNAEQAVPVGIIINELASNAYKHAFAGREDGELRVAFKQEGQFYKLEVGDDGPALPEGFNVSYNGDSIGMALVQSLAEEQLGGSFIISQGSTYKFSVLFNKPKAA